MRSVLLGIGLLLTHVVANAQEVTNGNTENSMQQVVNQFNQTLGTQADIYYGPDYTPYLFKMDGTPFYSSNVLFDGWVVYKGVRYEGLRMQLDLHRNMLVVQNPYTSSRNVLSNYYVDSFQLGSQTFVHFNENRALNLYKSGYFEVLYHGSKVMVYALRKKETREQIRDNILYRVFDQSTSYYIFKSGKFYLVDSRGDIVRVLGDKVDKKMKEQDVRVRKDNFEIALEIAAQIYDQLSN